MYKARIILFVFCFLCSLSHGVEFYVSPEGSDQNVGSRSAPFASLVTARDAIRLLDPKPVGGVTVWVRGGHYFDYPLLQLGQEDSGDIKAPIVYRAYQDEKPVFNGSKRIDLSGARVVTDKATLERLARTAGGQVMQLAVTDAAIQKLLGNFGVLSFDGQMMTLSRFPNIGYAHVGEILEKGAVYAQGRTKGQRPKSTMAEPIGGVIRIREETNGDWEKEFARVQKAKLSGYLSYDWYKEHHWIARITEGKVLKLLGHSRYGILGSEKIPRRLVIRNLLCEVDSAGEWYFDEIDNVLFFIPFGPVNENTMMGIWSGGSLVEINGASNIVIQGLTVSGVTGGHIISIKSGENNLVAGCTFKNSSSVAINISGGKNNGIRSCDLYDLGGHINVNGGNTAKLIPAGNYVENCHFTQVQATDFYGRIRINGVGNIFRNNLVHNFIGQVMALSGNDHLIERNEMFNIGYEEGDGGTIYSGAAMWSYGNVYRHNFLHHLMCVPQAHPRGGIYQDDHDAGDTIIENLFYKAAHRAVLLNHGAGHTVSRNVFVDGNIGIYNANALSSKDFATIAEFDSGKKKRGDKGDYIWRTEQVVGEKGWNNSPWKDKYPLFQKVMNQEKMRFFPIECTFTDNLFCGNNQNIVFLTSYGKNGTKDISTIDYITTANNRDVTKDIFVDAEQMDFRIKPSVKNSPVIPFEKIGLYADKYRTDVPDKEKYRRAIREKFAGRKSYDADAKYDPATIIDLSYFNTGRLLIQGN
jgi:hypothetical protein